VLRSFVITAGLDSNQPKGDFHLLFQPLNLCGVFENTLLKRSDCRML
jgi:hypothetical protein